LQEFDEAAANLLSSFKDFLDLHWGSVEFAFKTMDTDGSGALTFTELKRACQKFGWPGNVRHLFNCLDVQVAAGKRTLTYKEVAFLDSWVSKGDKEEEEVTQANGHDASGGSAGSGSRTPAGSVPAAASTLPAAPPAPAAQAAPQLQRSASCPAGDKTSLGSTTISLPPLGRHGSQRSKGASRSRRSLPGWQPTPPPRPKKVHVARTALLENMRRANESLKQQTAKLHEEKEAHRLEADRLRIEMELGLLPMEDEAEGEEEPSEVRVSPVLSQ